MNYENIVYISHPYGGDKNNLEIVSDLIRLLQEKYPTYLFLSPVNAFSFLYDTVSYKDGLNMCLWLLDNADEMWVFGDYQNSTGCNAEIAYCQNHLIPYRLMDEGCNNLHNRCTECGFVEYEEEWIKCHKLETSAIYGETINEY